MLFSEHKPVQRHVEDDKLQAKPLQHPQITKQDQCPFLTNPSAKLNFA